MLVPLGSVRTAGGQVAVGGGGALVGLVVVGWFTTSTGGSACASLYGGWPGWMSRWWDNNWPAPLDPGRVAEFTPGLQLVMVALGVLTLIGLWWGYAYPGGAATGLTSVGVVGFVIAGVFVLPFVGPVIGQIVYVGVIIVAVIAVAGVVIGLLAFFFR